MKVKPVKSVKNTKRVNPVKNVKQVDPVKKVKSVKRRKFVQKTNVNDATNCQKLKMMQVVTG